MLNSGNSNGNGSELCSRVINGLRAYWEAKRIGDGLPSRADIDPRGIEHALEYSFILERVTVGNGRFRIAGSYLNELMGMEVRGMPLTALFVPESRRRMTEATFATPAITWATLNGEIGYGRPALGAQMLLLPLRSDLGDVTRALGCIVSGGQIGRVPRRFEIASIRTESVGPIKQPVTGFAEDAPTFITKNATTPEARRRLFRIIPRD